MKTLRPVWIFTITAEINVEGGEKVKKHSRRGYTLVELITSFALLAVLMTAGIMITGSFLKIYTRANSLLLATNLSDTLAQTVTAELSAASATPWSADPQASADVIIADGTVLFHNEVGIAMAIYAQDGYLVVKYYAVPGENISAPPQDVLWGLGREAYTGCKIQSLQFSQGLDNIIRMELELTVESSGLSYKSNCMIECRNLSGSGSIQNWTGGTLPAPQ